MSLDYNDILADRTVVITGGTGSFGQTMVRCLLKTNVREIRILSRDETKQDYMRRSISDSRIKFYLGDVRDQSSITAAFKDANYCFHAAAIKHVPSSEFFPIEAVKTNVLGTQNIIETSRYCQLSKVVLLSTDKAVSPVNAMGMTKGLMERVGLAFSREQSEFPEICVTRYGNVIASRGSVLPHFIDQAKNGKKLTITNPNMTRFVMSLEEAVDLVLHAFCFGKTGELFVQKSPATTIKNLARSVNHIFGLGADNVQFIGIRHGEKMYETLLNAEEKRNAIEDKNFYRVCADIRQMNYDIYIDTGSETLHEDQEYNSNNTKLLGVDALCQMLLNNREILELVNKT